MTLENFGKHIGGFLYTDDGAVFVYKSSGGDFAKNSKDKTFKIYIIIWVIFFVLIFIFRYSDLQIFESDFIVGFFVVSVILFFCSFHYVRNKSERLALCVYSEGINLFNDKNKKLLINIPKEQIKEFCIEPLTIDDNNEGLEIGIYKLCIKSDYEIIKKSRKIKTYKFGSWFFDLGIHLGDKNKLLFLKQEFEKILGISDKTYYFVKTIDNN